MRQILILLILISIMSGCSNPTDIIFGPEPLKQIADQGDKFRKLSEEDRTLLVGYLTIIEMGKAFGAEIKPITGRTVGEVLVDAKAWKVKVIAAEAETKKQDAEAETLKNKIITERKAIANKISSSVIVAIIDKTVLPKNYEAGRFSEMLSIKYAVENKSDKTIQQLKGQVIFKDATGDEVGTLYADIDEPIRAGQTLTTTTGRGWELNQFNNGDVEKIAGRDFSSMKATFEPESVAFEGGEVLKAPNLP